MINFSKKKFSKMSFFIIPRRKTIQLLLFIILFKMTLQQGPLKESKELVGHANSLLNKVKEGNFGAKLATEWVQKNAIGILCNGKFELKMDKSLQKLQNEFCKSFENKNFEKMTKIFQTTKIEKKTFDKSQMDKAIAKDQMLNDNNKRMFKKLFNNSSKIVEIYETLLKEEKLAVLQHKPNNFMGRRKKRADYNKFTGCIAGVTLTIVSTILLGIYGNKYAHEGNVQVGVTHCPPRSLFCYNDHHSVHGMVILWAVLLAVGLICALFFCFCACM